MYLSSSINDFTTSLINSKFSPPPISIGIQKLNSSSPSLGDQVFLSRPWSYLFFIHKKWRKEDNIFFVIRINILKYVKLKFQVKIVWSHLFLDNLKKYGSWHLIYQCWNFKYLSTDKVKIVCSHLIFEFNMKLSKNYIWL